MRIISGQYGGRRFETPRNLDARPTTDTAREALFNILANRLDFEGLTALDLFGGTGSVSFELLSRGAARVTCVELGRVQQQFIRRVAAQLGVGHGLQLVCGDVFRYLKGCPPCGFVFADPPYALPQLSELPQLVLEGGVLLEGGLFVLEHGRDHDFSAHPRFVESRAYGAVHFTFFA